MESPEKPVKMEYVLDITCYRGKVFIKRKGNKYYEQLQDINNKAVHCSKKKK